MSTLVSSATGNFTAAGTWKVADATSLQFNLPNSEVTTTVFKASTNSTPGAITVDAIGLFVNFRVVPANGTCTVELYNSTTATSIQTVVVNVADLPVNFGWCIFPFAPTLLVAAQNYQVRIKSSVANSVSVFRDATVSNWTKLLRKTTTAAPAAADYLLVCGELTGAGTGNRYTVTMDNTTGTVFGTNSGSHEAISVNTRGTLAYGTLASTAYRLCVAGYLATYDNSTFTIGTEAAKLPNTSTATLEFNVAVTLDSYLYIGKGSTINCEGTLTQNVARALLTADVAIAATTLTTDVSTGWKAGDQIAIAPTGRTITEGESRTLSIDAAGTTVTLSSGLTYAHAGVAQQAEVINLSRNIKIFGTSLTLCAYVRILDLTVTGMEQVEFYYMGSAVASKRGVTVETVDASVITAYFRGCSFHDFWQTASTAVGLMINATNVNFEAFNCDFWNTNYIGIYAPLTPANNLLLDGNICIGTGGAGYGILTNSGNSSVKNSRCAGYGAGLSIADAGSQYKIATIDNNVAHSCTTGMIFSGIFDGSVTNCIAWRTGGQGLSINLCTNVLFDTISSIGNASSSLTIANNKDCVIKSLTGRSESGFTQPYGHYIAGLNPGTIIANSVLGGAGVWSNTIADIVTTTITNSIIYHNTQFLSPTELAISVWKKGGGYQSEKHQGVANNNKRVAWEGTSIYDSTIYKIATPSQRLTPTQATVKMQSTSWELAVAAGGTSMCSVYIRRSVVGDGTAYNGNPPRMMLKATPVNGIYQDTVLATSSGPAGTWELLMCSGPTAVENTVFECYIDCDGTQGWINIDDAETSSIATGGFNVWASGLPFIGGGALLTDFTDVPVDKVELGYTYNYNSPTSNRTGTRRQPSIGQVQIGVAYGPSDALAGTYNGSDRWTDPGVSNVRLGTAYKVNSLTNNATGTVRVPTVGQVKIGVVYDASDSLTGAYDGTERWTDPGDSNVRYGVAYKANSTTANKTGRVTLPVVTNVLTGVAYDTDAATIGTLSIPSAAANALAVWSQVLEPTFSAEQLMRVMASVLGGKVSGAGSGTETFRDLADTKNVVVVTTDPSGNRLNVVRDVT